MNVNQLILLLKNKIKKNILIQNITIRDKTYLHKKHISHMEGKFHLELKIKFTYGYKKKFWKKKY